MYSGIYNFQNDPQQSSLEHKHEMARISDLPMDYKKLIVSKDEIKYRLIRIACDSKFKMNRMEAYLRLQSYFRMVLVRKSLMNGERNRQESRAVVQNDVSIDVEYSIHRLLQARYCMSRIWLQSVADITRRIHLIQSKTSTHLSMISAITEMFNLIDVPKKGYLTHFEFNRLFFLLNLPISSSEIKLDLESMMDPGYTNMIVLNNVILWIYEVKIRGYSLQGKWERIKRILRKRHTIPDDIIINQLRLTMTSTISKVVLSRFDTANPPCFKK